MDNNDAEFDAIIMFEQIRKVSEATYLKNPLDADVSSLIRNHSFAFSCLISAL